MRIAIFAYNWPHRKTIDTITTLHAHGFDIGVVLAAPPVPMETKTEIRTRVKHKAWLHPQLLCKALNLSYIVAPHRHDTSCAIIQSFGCDLGVIAGARILPKDVIDLFPRGILNLHPGRLPEIRGLRAAAKTVARAVRPAVTAHLIDEKVDAGEVLAIADVDVRTDDTIYDLEERLYCAQFPLMVEVLRVLRGTR